MGPIDDDPIYGAGDSFAWPPPHWDLGAPQVEAPGAQASDQGLIEMPEDYVGRGASSAPGAQAEIKGTPETGYQTPLSTDENKAFQAWATKNKAPITDDYDMPGFWKALQSGDERAKTAINQSDNQLHFPDTWKTPLHKTFSNESIYATGGEPRWIGDALIAQDGTVIADERTAAEKKREPIPEGAYSLSYEQSNPLTPPTIEMPDDYVGASAPETQYPQMPDALHQMQHALAPDILQPGLEPDAISGPSGQPPAGPIRSTSDDIVNDYIAHPEKIAAEEAASRDQAVAQYHTGALHALTDKQQAEDRAWQVYQAGMAKAQQMQQDIANTKIDPNHLMKNLSAGRMILGFIAMGLGGAMSGGTGGRNLALEQVNKAIDDDIESQKANLGARQNALGEFVRQTGDMYSAEMKYRAGVWNNTLARLDTEQQNYDSHGQIYRDIAKQKVIATQQRDAAAIAGAQQHFKNIMDAAKADAEIAEKNANAQKLLAEADKARAKVGVGAPVAPAIKTYGTVFPSYNEVPDKQRHMAFTLPTGGVMVANNDKNAEQAQVLSEAYTAVDHDLNELQRIAIERNNAKSLGGSLASRWSDAQEHHYQQLLIDVANTYGTTIHGGRPLPSGTLEEVMKVMPQLKTFIDGGNTTEEISKLRDDIDNRMSRKLSVLAGAPVQVKSNRPHVEPPNANTIAAPLRSAAVQGDSGFLPMDVADASARLHELAQHYQQNPSLGGTKELAKEYDRIDEAQHKAIASINSDILAIQAKKTRTPADEARLRQNKQALADRQQVLSAIVDARKINVEDSRQKAGQAAAAATARDYLESRLGDD